ncbi:MAG: hypothetical protein ACI31S_01430 [Bacilli bacterium]
MNKNTYVIRITTIDNLYSDYMIEAENLFFAKMKARNTFFKTYPGVDINIKLSLEKPTTDNIREILNIIKEGK